MKNFNDFIKYLSENNVSTKIFEKAKSGDEIKPQDMFMAVLYLLEEYHDWLNR